MGSELSHTHLPLSVNLTKSEICPVLSPVKLGAIAMRGVNRPSSDRRKRVRSILGAVREGGLEAILTLREEFDQIPLDAPFILGPEDLKRAEESLTEDVHGLLSRCASRIGAFARRQLGTAADLDVDVPGGRAGHRLIPIHSVGCYAPGGRQPLPTIVLMTALTAKVAGVARVIVATPNQDPLMAAAASIAGADGMLIVGGAHGMGALAYGFDEFAPVDKIVGPGSSWTSLAKMMLFGDVGVDGISSPSELLVIADAGADPEQIAADLLAQSEQNPEARPMLISTSHELIDQVQAALGVQLQSLTSSAITVRSALENGFISYSPTIEEALNVAEQLSPQQVQLLYAGAKPTDVTRAGSVLIGPKGSVVCAAYGPGPNHILPAAGAAACESAISVFTFLRRQTYLELDDPDLSSDIHALAVLEGLDARSRAALRSSQRP